MKLKGFKEYITEKQTDLVLVLKMQEFAQDTADTCPRCGKPNSDCICATRDYGSTINLYRLGKGKIKKQKSNFKTES